jgi:hypothetical protein
MTLLSSREGKFYDVPEGDLSKFEVPAKKVKQILSELDDEMDSDPGGPSGGPAQVVIYVSGNGAHVEPYGRHWEHGWHHSHEPHDESVEPYGGHWGGWHHSHEPHWSPYFSRHSRHRW